MSSYKHLEARQENFFRRSYAIGEEVRFPNPNRFDPDRVLTGRITAESVTEPGRWYLRDEYGRHLGPFWPDQLLTA